MTINQQIRSGLSWFNFNPTPPLQFNLEPWLGVRATHLVLLLGHDALQQLGHPVEQTESELANEGLSRDNNTHTHTRRERERERERGGGGWIHLLPILLVLLAHLDELQDVVVGTEVQRANVHLDILLQKILCQPYTQEYNVCKVWAPQEAWHTGAHVYTGM